MKIKLLTSLFILISFSILAQGWKGSGVVISHYGYIATCNHTLETGAHFEVDVFNNGIKKTFLASVIKNDPANDIAILKIDDPLFGVIGATPYTLKVKDVKEKEKIFVMQYGEDAQKDGKTKVQEGTITSKSGYPNDIGSFQLSTIMKQGSEGAPVFDGLGNLIGIINSKIGQGNSYATKASCIENVIETITKMPAMASKTIIGAYSQNDKIDVLNKFVVVVRTTNVEFANAEKTNRKQVGQTYGGGIIFYVDSTGQHGLIASIDNGEGDRAQWGCYNEETEATEIGIGTGIPNTKKILTSCRTGAHIAARLCSEAVIEGYSDWFLPSKEELNLLYENKEIIGGYQHGYYWSSSEVDAHFAWYQHFDFGFQDYLNKDFSYYFRPIRAF